MVTITAAEKQILENQRIILHGLRTIVSKLELPDHQYQTLQSQMTETEDFLRNTQVRG